MSELERGKRNRVSEFVKKRERERNFGERVTEKEMERKWWDVKRNKTADAYFPQSVHKSFPFCLRGEGVPR